VVAQGPFPWLVFLRGARVGGDEEGIVFLLWPRAASNGPCLPARELTRAVWCWHVDPRHAHLDDSGRCMDCCELHMHMSHMPAASDDDATLTYFHDV